MVALHDWRQGAAYISLTIWFFLSVTQVVGERAQGASANSDSRVETQHGRNDIPQHRQLNRSSVEVGPRHLLLTGAPQEKLVQEALHPMAAMQISEPDADGVFDFPTSNGAEVNPLHVADVPEISHVEAAMLGGDEGRYSHFQELLRLKPKVEAAIGTYRDDIAAVKTQAHGVVKKGEDVIASVAEVKAGLKSVDDAEDGAKKESEKETRKLGIDSVENFVMYNKHGVFGNDAKGKWSPEAGKWNIFKDFLEEHGKKGEGSASTETDHVEAASAPADSSPTEHVAPSATDSSSTDHVSATPADSASAAHADAVASAGLGPHDEEVD